MTTTGAPSSSSLESISVVGTKAFLAFVLTALASRNLLYLEEKRRRRQESHRRRSRRKGRRRRRRGRRPGDGAAAGEEEGGVEVNDDAADVNRRNQQCNQGGPPVPSLPSSPSDGPPSPPRRKHQRRGTALSWGTRPAWLRRSSSSTDDGRSWSLSDDDDDEGGGGLDYTTPVRRGSGGGGGGEGREELWTLRRLRDRLSFDLGHDAAQRHFRDGCTDDEQDDDEQDEEGSSSDGEEEETDETDDDAFFGEYEHYVETEEDDGAGAASPAHANAPTCAAADMAPLKIAARIEAEVEANASPVGGAAGETGTARATPDKGQEKGASTTAEDDPALPSSLSPPTSIRLARSRPQQQPMMTSAAEAAARSRQRRRRTDALTRQCSVDFHPKNSNWTHFEDFNGSDDESGPVDTPVQENGEESDDDDDEEDFLWTEARRRSYPALARMADGPGRGRNGSSTTGGTLTSAGAAERLRSRGDVVEGGAARRTSMDSENLGAGADDELYSRPASTFSSISEERHNGPSKSEWVASVLRRVGDTVSSSFMFGDNDEEVSYAGSEYDDESYAGDECDAIVPGHSSRSPSPLRNGVTTYGSRRAELEPATNARGQLSESSAVTNKQDANINTPRRLESARADYNARIMPSKVVLVRHGQSEGNMNESLYATKPDNAMRLTRLGWEQARMAGKALRERVLNNDETVHFIVSPYVRTVETFHGLASAWCDPNNFRHIKDRDKRLKAWYGRLLELGLTWHEDPRIREQDFGNYQDPAAIKKAKSERHKFGVFYYRFPHGESASDVFDRVSTFLDSLWRSFDLKRSRNYVLVTHGISIRVLLARYFRYSIDQFNMLANPRNCEMVVLGHDGLGKLTLEGRCELSLKIDEENDGNSEPRKVVVGYDFYPRLRILPRQWTVGRTIRMSFDDSNEN